MSIETVRRATIHSHVDTHSGYGHAIQQTFNWLQKRGIYVTLRPIAVNEAHGQIIPKEMRGQISHPLQPEPWEILFAPPTNRPTPNKKTVFISMWESTRLTDQTVAFLNCAQHVIVPCQWCATSFMESGVTKPLSVNSLGFDPEVFYPTPISERGPTVFGVAGRVAHCAKRKMIQEAVDLFVATFTGVDDVRLHVKIHPDDELKVPILDKRIKVFRDVIEPYQLGNWLRELTAYVTLSRAEGFGLFPLQSLACGRPVIGCAYSGQADFMTAENSFMVKHREVAVDGVGDANVAYDGSWAQPDMKNAGAIMMSIHRKRIQAIEKGKICAASVNHLTWEKTVDSLIALLEKVGAL